jgi:hypothetical protein
MLHTISYDTSLIGLGMEQLICVVCNALSSDDLEQMTKEMFVTVFLSYINVICIQRHLFCG